MATIKTFCLAISTILLTNCTNNYPIDNASPIYALPDESDSVDIFNDKVLYGSWFTPHMASAKNITFRKDKTFEMNDYKQTGDSFILLTREGTFSINDETITLICDNGEKQALEIIEIEGRVYLCHNNTMMIKGMLN